MSKQQKKIFLIASIVIPFMAYCLYYYGMMVKNAPYKFVEFNYFVLQYGPGDSLINKYNSQTGDYQYLNKHDSLIKTNVKLTRDDLQELHRTAADLGFWNFPTKETTDTVETLNGAKAPRYLIEFSYKRKTKRVLFDATFNGDPKLIDANERLIRAIEKVLNEAEAKQHK